MSNFQKGVEEGLVMLNRFLNDTTLQFSGKKKQTRKKIILAEVFCSCNDLRTENVILINWHDQPELLPGQVESGACKEAEQSRGQEAGEVDAG